LGKTLAKGLTAADLCAKMISVIFKVADAKKPKEQN
ncbi:hypothetical protein L914_10590, partial [Phytophthora nicotianae]